MLLRWFPMLRPRLRPGDSRFKHSLVRTVLIVLLLTSLFPILLIGTINLFRSHALLREQVSNQLSNVASLEVQEMQDYVKVRDTLISRVVTDETFKSSLNTLLTQPASSNDFQNAQFSINYMFKGRPQTSMEGYYDNMLIARPDGTILTTTSDIWAQGFGKERLTNTVLQGMIGQNKSSFVFSPSPAYMNKLVLITARSFVDDKGNLQATLISVATSDETTRTLVNASSFIPGANSFIFSQQGEVIGLGLQNWLKKMPDNASITQKLVPLYTTKNNRSLFNGKSYYGGETATVIAQWVPEYNIGIILLVPEQSLFHQIGFLDPFSAVVLLISMAISGSLIYYSSTRLVRPLVQLSNAADHFSKGNWSQRANVHRSDEIGLLAYSFNHMADELSQLYHSLEGVVERRTSQLRIASEVAQLATLSTKLTDTLGRTVALIAERFGFYHVAIYLVDGTGQSLSLTEASGSSGEAIKQRGDRAALNKENIIGWVTANSQARIISKVQEDSLFRPDPLLPDTMSEVAIPIVIGDEVLGVLDIQSTLVDAFDEETVAIFQTLANQISTTLQTTRLLESTQISYQETSLLYRATRQVTQARSEEEILRDLTDTFIQLPYIGSVLAVRGENFHIQVVTDSKTGRVEKTLQSIKIPVGRMGELLAENRIVLIEDIAQSSDYDNLLSFLLRRQCKSAALVSVLENGVVSKVLALGAREENQITHTSLQPYANLADVIGTSLEKISVLQTLQQRLTELQTLANFSQALSAETDVTRLYRVLHQQVTQTIGVDLEFAVATYDAKKNLINFPYFIENGQPQNIPPSQLGEGLTSIVIQSGKPLFLKDDAANNITNGITEGRPPRSWLGVPLIFGGSPIGAVIIQDLNNENRFTEDDLNLFMTLAPQIATSVRNAQLYTEAQQALRAYDQERFLLNTLLDNMPEGITFKDTHGRYIRTSSSVARIYNMSAEAMVGKTDYDLLDRDIAEKIFRDEQMVMNIGRPEIGLIQYMVTKDGKESWTHTSRIPVRTVSGDPYGMLIIQRDVTELKQAEALAQRRADQVLMAAEIARDTTGTLDVKILLQKSVNLVRERFGFYHASIFLIDPANEYAVLRESTGEAGRQMLQAGHHLAVGSKSIVGQVTATGQPIIVNDVEKDPTHFPNPLLPDTRSELGIPLKIGERILGALDVQSTQADAFNPEDVSVLRILADQMAVAVTNGELFAKTQELLGKHRLLRQITIAASASTNLEDALSNVVSGLRTAMAGDRIAVLLLDEDETLHLQASAGYEGDPKMDLRIPMGKGIAGTAAAEKRPVLVNDTNSDQRYINLDPKVRSELAIPILFSDELIGVLDLESTSVAAFDENDQEILGALGNNLGGVIANIRLVTQVQAQVVRERQLFEVTSKIRRSVDLETILETSTREIARALGARRARIEIKPGTSIVESQNMQSSGADSDLNDLLGSPRRNGKNGNHGSHGQEA